jgi:hypothetical protein
MPNERRPTFISADVHLGGIEKLLLPSSSFGEDADVV